MRMIRKQLLVMFALVLALASCRSSAEYGSAPEQLINQSRISFQSMMGDNQYPSLVDLMTRARAVIIAPGLGQGGFFFGGRGGNAVMLVRGDDGKWSPPAFYTIGGISWGLQFGIQVSELVITVMSQKGVDAIMNRQVTLGANAGLAVGELGKGANAATGMDTKADMYAFARSEGLFVGVSLEGSMITPRETLDQELYGPDATPRGILVDRNVNANSQAVSDIIAAMP